MGDDGAFEGAGAGDQPGFQPGDEGGGFGPEEGFEGGDEVGQVCGATDGGGAHEFAADPAGGEFVQRAGGVGGEPEEAGDDLVQVDGTGAKRTEAAQGGRRGFDDAEVEGVGGGLPDEEARFGGPGAGAVEFGAEMTEEMGFVFQRMGFGFAELEIDAGDVADEAEVAAGHAVGVGDAIVVEALAEVFGFADVEGLAGGVAHKVNTRVAGCGAEEVGAELLVERAGVGEQEELRHGGILG